MDGQSDESAAELADRYREKVEARRRGAGTHQSRFRGFTLTGADNPPQKPIASTPSGTTNRATRASVSRKSEVDVTELEQEEETTTITKTLSSLTVTSEASSTHRPVTRSLVGLNDRYKERVNARIRGAGVHQSDFRGFTIKPTKADKSKVDQAKEALVEIRDREPSRRVSSRRQTTLQLRGPETSVPEITDTISRNDTSKPRPSVASGSSDEAPVKKAPNVRPRPKARSAKTPSKVNEQPGPEKSRQEQNRAEDDFFRKTTAPVQTPNATKTRSSSRQSGESPTFRISWGKNDTTVITDSHGDGTRSSTVHNSPKRRFDQDEILDDHSADMDVDQDFGDSYVNDDGPSSDSDLQDPIPDTTNIQALPLTKDQSSTRAPAPVKRRRLIQEEVDENDNPHMDPEFSTKATSRSKKIVESLADPKPMAKPAAKSAAKERTTLVESDRNTSESTKKTSKKAAAAKAQPSVRKELKQATLLQLVAKPKKKPTQDESLGSTTPLPDDQNYADLSDFEDDFQKSNVRTKTPATLGLEKSKSKSLLSSSKPHKAKGSTDKNVKVYKQLQIQCLKFLGPSTSVSKPATVRNPEIAKQLPVPGETPVNNNNEEEAPKKLVQGVLEIEQAPLSEMDVIAEAVRDVIDNFIDGLEDQALAKDMLILRSDLETLLIEQVDLLDDHALMKASVKKAEGVKKELRVRLLETQRRRHKVREKLARVRSKFEREDRARRRLEDTHKFLTDLEALRDQAEGVEEEEGFGRSDRTVKTGLQSFIATVGARSCGGGDKDSERPPQPGALGTLKDFNRLLESLTS